LARSTGSPPRNSAPLSRGRLLVYMVLTMLISGLSVEPGGRASLRWRIGCQARLVMKHVPRFRCWSAPRSAFAGFRFPSEVIMVAVRWYLRYGLSYRDVEELLAERGIGVDHVTVYRWVQRFTPLLADAARFARHAPGDRWFVDETYVKVNGVWRYVYRAIDEHGQVIDVLLSTRRPLISQRNDAG
jgi:hypothetical protein